VEQGQLNFLGNTSIPEPLPHLLFPKGGRL
jgi:hypothetical protein